MTETFGSRQASAFSKWLRTGRRPSATGSDGLELKFNPWHDPSDGRFTFAGTGRRYGSGGTNGAGDRASGRVGRTDSIGLRNTPRTASLPRVEAQRVDPLARDGRRLAERQPSTVRRARISGSLASRQPNPVTEFVGGVGQGLYGVGKETVAGVHAALTTNPATTIRNAGRGIAGMIDSAIAAEETPARIQVSRAADAVVNASARDIGRATGTVAGNVALAAAPGAVLARASTLRRVSMATPRPAYHPPQIGWVKETINSEKAWKAYNDAATGSRPGLAPTLMRMMPDGSKRPVKFDGFQSDYVIDRKWSVVNAPHARAQVLRQSDVLSQHRLIGLWEVPTPVQKVKALKLLKMMNVTNIKVRIVKP